MPLAPLWNVPSLPPNFLPHPEELDALKAKLLRVDQSVVMTGVGVPVQGMGGLGKSVLAAAIAQDPTIRAEFPDGVFGLTVGQEDTSRLLEVQTSLA